MLRDICWVLAMTSQEQARAILGCEVCGLPYGSEGWVDVVIPDDIWNSLDKGLLCFTCMTRALVLAGHKDVPVIVASGPYRDANEEWRLIGWEHGHKVALTQSTPQWTKENPKVDGYYWYRDKWTKKPFLTYISDITYKSNKDNSIFKCNGQWSGPLTPPEETAS